MPASNNKEIEGYCPKCEKLFNSETEMLEHYDAEHEGTKEKPKIKNEEVYTPANGLLVIGEETVKVAAYTKLGADYVILMFTKSRVILSNPKSVAGALGGLLVGGLGGMIIGSMAYDEGRARGLYLSLIKNPEKPEEIMKSCKGNYSTPISEVEKIKLGVKKVGFLHLRQITLEIETAGSKTVSFPVFALWGLGVQTPKTFLSARKNREAHEAYVKQVSCIIKEVFQNKAEILL